LLFDENVTSCLCSGQVECNEAIDVLSHKLGVHRVGPGGKESRTVFERMSYNGKMSIVKCAYLATSRLVIVKMVLIVILIKIETAFEAQYPMQVGGEWTSTAIW